MPGLTSRKGPIVPFPPMSASRRTGPRSGVAGSAGSGVALLADDVEGAAGAEPGDVLVVHGLRARERHHRAVGLVDLALDRAIGGQVGQAGDGDAVVLLDLVV